MKDWKEPDMLFKKIKFRFISYVYSRLISVLRKTSVFFSSTDNQDLYTDKAVNKQRNISPSAENKHSPDEDNSYRNEDEFYRFAGAPQHWLAFIKRNNITFYNFSRQSYRNRLPVKKTARQKESIEALKVKAMGNAANAANTANAIRENSSNTLKMSKLLSQYTDKPIAYSSNNDLTDNDTKNDNDNNNDNVHDNIKSGIRLKSAVQSLFSKVDKMLMDDVQKDSYIPLTQAVFQAETNNRKNWKNNSEPARSNKNTSDLQAQLNIASPVNKLTKSQVDIFSQRQLYGSRLENDYLLENRLENDQKFKSDITQKELLSENTHKKNYIYRNRVKSDSVKAYANEAELNWHSMQYLQDSTNITTDETTASCWQDLPEDVWDEMKAEKVFAIPHIADNDSSDIRKLLWNG